MRQKVASSFLNALAVLTLIISVRAAPGAVSASSPGAAALSPEGAGDSGTCAGLHPAAIRLDGAVLDLCLPRMPGSFVGPTADSAAQVATAGTLDPFYEVSVTAAPYGSRAPSEALPVAQPGSETVFRSMLRQHRQETGTYLGEGPAARLFGKEIASSASLSRLYVTPERSRTVLIAEWVVEAGERVWIVRVSQEYRAETRSAETTGQMLAPLAELSMDSADLSKNPAYGGAGGRAEARRSEGDEGDGSTKGSRGAQSVDGPGRAAGTGGGRPQVGDLPTPPWWDGDCDTNTYEAGSGGIKASPLGATYRGLKACGPRPWYDEAPDVLVRFFPGSWGEFEWECVELSMRYLYLAYSIAPYPANGSTVVPNYSGDRLEKIANGEAGKAPQPGDVLSSGATSTWGHTEVVTASNVNSSGDGTIDVIEQNSTVDGRRTHSVVDWVVQSNQTVSGWLHEASAEKRVYLPALVREVATGGWSQIGPAGAHIQSVLALSDDDLLAGAEEGIYHTEDRGATWALLNGGLPNNVSALAQSPITPTVVWAGSGAAGLYRTEDGGLTWSLRSGGAQPFAVSAFAINPSRPQQLFAGAVQLETASGNVYRTDNEGIDWVPVLPAHTGATAVVVDPADAQTVYVVSGQTRLLKSADGGASWVQLHLASPDPAIRSLAVITQEHSLLYAATGAGVFGSSDGGANWQILSLGLPNSAFDALAVRPGSPATLYVAIPHDPAGIAGSGTDIYSTTDDGQNWQPAGRVPDPLYYLTAPPGNSHYLFGASGERIWALRLDL